jgi:hypothetical protein
MPINSNPSEFTILNGGLVQTIDVDETNNLYKIIGTAGTLASDNTFGHTGTLYDGLTYEYDYQASATYAGGVVKFHGVAMTATQALKNHRVIATYNGSAWEVMFVPDLAEDGIIEAAKLANNAVSGDKIASGAVTTVKLPNSTLTTDGVTLAKMAYLASGTIIGNDGGADAVPQALSLLEVKTMLDQDVTLTGDVTGTATQTFATGVTTIATTIAAGSIHTAMIVNDQVTVAKIENNLTYELITLLVSFEAAGGTVPSVGDFKIKMPYPGTVSEIYAYCTKAIAATDAGTITAKNNAGTTMTSGVVTFAVSDARGTAYTVTPSADNTFIAGDILTFTTAKVTAGGQVHLSIKVIHS